MARKLSPLLPALVLVLVLLVGAVFAWLIARGVLQNSGFESIPNATQIAETIRGLGPWGVAASIGLMILHSFVPFPAEILGVANGLVYGTLAGTAVTWSGAMLGAYLSFGLARLLGRPFVQRIVSERTLESMDRWTEREGGLTLLICRLIPLIAFNVINYAAGLTRVSWWTFTWSTGLGILPVTVLMAALGDRMLERSWWGVSLLLLVAATAILGYRFLARHRGQDAR